MTAGSEDGTKGELGRLRASHADREAAIDLLKAAFVQGRLTKDEFDQRVGQVFVSRTYSALAAVTADIPGEVISAQPSHRDATEPGKVMRFRTAAAVGSVGAVVSMASAASVLLQSGVPAVAGVLLVGATGLVVTVLLAALLMLLSWVARGLQRGAAAGPPSGPDGLRSKRRAPARPLPPASRVPWHAAEAAMAVSLA